VTTINWMAEERAKAEEKIALNMLRKNLESGKVAEVTGLTMAQL
jgi:hypothetical protein